MRRVITGASYLVRLYLAGFARWTRSADPLPTVQRHRNGINIGEGARFPDEPARSHRVIDGWANPDAHHIPHDQRHGARCRYKGAATRGLKPRYRLLNLHARRHCKRPWKVWS